MFGGRHGTGRLCQPGCAAVQRTDLEDTARHQRSLRGWRAARGCLLPGIKHCESATKFELREVVFVFK